MTSPSIVAGHPHLNPNAVEAAFAMAERGMLRQFHTSLDFTKILRRIPSGALAEQLRRRSLPDIVAARTVGHPWTETLRLARRALHVEGRRSYSPDATAHAVDRAVARSLRPSDTAVYAYEDSAEATFRRAQDLGLRRVYDLPIGYWRAAESIMEEERQLNPSWAHTFVGPDIRNQALRLQRKDNELALASEIVVASSFTESTLSLANDWPGSVAVVPYGAPSPQPPEHPGRSGGKLRVLFVGALSQRKGVSYLFEAMRGLGRFAELTLIGRPVGDASMVREAVRKADARWTLSMSHREILEEMRLHDVLVFPSLFEGFGLVLTEALSRGLPVITTPHTAGPDVVTHGQDGWIVPIRSPAAIKECLEILLGHFSPLVDMRAAAIDWAISHQWSGYRENLAYVLSGER